MRVIVDSKEKGRIDKAVSFFQGEGYQVNVLDVEYGDYIFIDKNTQKTCAFEYKTCSDFINSVTNHKVFNQALNQTEQFDYHFVCIEFSEELRRKLTDELYYREQIIFTKGQFYGAIARLNTYTTVITAENQKTCFELMGKQAKKCFDDKTITKSLKKVTDNSAMNYLVNCCYGIGVKTAENITGELKLFTLQDLLNLNKPLLLQVNGVGEKTADKILKNIKDDSQELS